MNLIGFWILFQVQTNDEPKIQEELMEVTTNDEFKFIFKDGYQQFWLQKQINTAYLGLWTVVEQFLIVFPLS